MAARYDVVAKQAADSEEKLEEDEGLPDSLNIAEESEDPESTSKGGTTGEKADNDEVSGAIVFSVSVSLALAVCFAFLG